MGNYFEDVYLKRMNKDGLTRQDRIKTRKEKEFDKIYLQRTEYQAYLYEVNEEQCAEICSLQPNKWNESNLISNLLVSTSGPQLRSGDILRIRQKIKSEEIDKIWLILFVDENLSKGYHSYKIICLDTEVNFTDEYGTTEFSFPAKFVSSTQNFVQDTFIHSATQLGYREPSNLRFFLTRDFDFIKKARYFDYKDKGWEIYGIDNISIEGVAYITISEKLKREAEPVASKDIPVGENTNFFLNGGV